MTDHTDLIARLRKDDLFWEAPITCRSEAADALEAAQAEIEAQQHRIQALWMERDVVRVERDKALARLAEIERQEPVQPSQGLQSVADALTIEQLNDKVARLMAAQPSQAPTCDLRGIDAGPLSEWVDLVRRGYVAKDECLIAVKDVPKWLAQNQPSQAGEVSKQDIYDIAHRKATRYVCTAAPSDVMYGFSEMHLLDFVAAINAKESK